MKSKKENIQDFIAIVVVVAALMVWSICKTEDVDSVGVCVDSIADVTDGGNIPIDTVADECEDMCGYPIMTDEESERMECMRLAIAKAESNNNWSAYNAKEDAVNDMQERRIVVDECNRIRQIYLDDPIEITYEDRYDHDIAKYIFYVVQFYHNPGLDIDTACDVWNPGCPSSYRAKVRNEFARLMREGGRDGWQ